jgi:hypothetical protein
VLCLVLIAGLAGRDASAQEPEAPGWIPSIDLGFEAFSFDTQSSIQNHINPPAQEDSQRNESVQWLFQLGAELMAPAFDSLPGKPRLFIGGGAQFKRFSADRIYSVGDIEDSPETKIRQFYGRRQADLDDGCEDFMPDGAPTGCLTAEAGEFTGQGARIAAGLQNPSWYAALGVAFEIPMGTNLLLQVKPSVAYNVEEVEFVGQFTTITEPSMEVFEVHRSPDTRATVTDHSLGAGLEVGVVLFRSLRPVRTTLYADARFLWLLSDPTTTFTDSLGFATFSVTRENFTFRGGAGVRFGWVGFGGR